MLQWNLSLLIVWATWEALGLKTRLFPLWEFSLCNSHRFSNLLLFLLGNSITGVRELLDLSPIRLPIVSPVSPFVQLS